MDDLEQYNDFIIYGNDTTIWPTVYVMSLLSVWKMTSKLSFWGISIEPRHSCFVLAAAEYKVSVLWLIFLAWFDVVTAVASTSSQVWYTSQLSQMAAEVFAFFFFSGVYYFMMQGLDESAEVWRYSGEACRSTGASSIGNGVGLHCICLKAQQHEPHEASSPSHNPGNNPWALCRLERRSLNFTGMPY